MPYQCNITLKYSQTAHIALFKHAFSRYFLAFCLLEEICILLRGNRVILGLIVFMLIIVISML